MYEYLVYDNSEFVSIASLNDEIYKRTITCSGLSKSYSMTGWRIGYAGASKEIAKLMSSIQSHQASNPNSIAQAAAVEALNGPQDAPAVMKAEFDRRRKYMVERLRKIKGITCAEPKGAFYVFVDVSALYGKTFDGKVIDGSLSFADAGLKKGVALIPGIAFGDDNSIRLSYAISMEDIKEGIDRIESFISELK